MILTYTKILKVLNLFKTFVDTVYSQYLGFLHYISNNFFIIFYFFILLFFLFTGLLQFINHLDFLDNYADLMNIHDMLNHEPSDNASSNQGSFTKNNPQNNGGFPPSDNPTTPAQQDELTVRCTKQLEYNKTKNTFLNVLSDH